MSRTPILSDVSDWITQQLNFGNTFDPTRQRPRPEPPQPVRVTVGPGSGGPAPARAPAPAQQPPQPAAPARVDNPLSAVQLPEDLRRAANSMTPQQRDEMMQAIGLRPNSTRANPQPLPGAYATPEAQLMGRLADPEQFQSQQPQARAAVAPSAAPAARPPMPDNLGPMLPGFQPGGMAQALPPLPAVTQTVGPGLTPGGRLPTFAEFSQQLRAAAGPQPYFEPSLPYNHPQNVMALNAGQQMLGTTASGFNQLAANAIRAGEADTSRAGVVADAELRRLQLLGMPGLGGSLAQEQARTDIMRQETQRQGGRFGQSVVEQLISQGFPLPEAMRQASEAGVPLGLTPGASSAPPMTYGSGPAAGQSSLPPMPRPPSAQGQNAPTPPRPGPPQQARSIPSGWVEQSPMRRDPQGRTAAPNPLAGIVAPQGLNVDTELGALVQQPGETAEAYASDGPGRAWRFLREDLPRLQQRDPEFVRQNWGRIRELLTRQIPPQELNTWIWGDWQQRNMNLSNEPESFLGNAFGPLQLAGRGLGYVTGSSQRTDRARALLRTLDLESLPPPGREAITQSVAPWTRSAAGGGWHGGSDWPPR